MADIDVVPKGRSTTWLWILLALVIVAVLLVAVFASRADASAMLQQFDPTIQALTSTMWLI